MTTPPALSHRFTVRAEVGPYRRVGDGVGGVLQVIPITGGEVTGAGLDGVVLPGGADWAVFRPDGSVLVEARYQIQTAGGTIVDVLNTGLAGRPAEGAEVPTYFPTSPTFRTDAEEHRWLLDSLFLGWARVAPEATTIEVFEVLAPPDVSLTEAPTRLAGYLGKATAFTRGPAGVPADDIKLSWGGPGATLEMTSWQFGDLDFALFEGDRGVSVQPAVRQRVPWTGLVVGMCLGGDVLLEQAGRATVLSDGHFTFFHGHAPYRISTDGAHRWLVCRLRFLRIGLDTQQVGGLLASEIPTDRNAAGLLAHLLRGALTARDTLTPSGKLHCADAVHSLVRAVIEEAAHPGGPRPATDPFGRYTQWLEERIETAGLDAEQVAAAHHVSVRHVRAVFAGNGITVSTFVRERRLEHLRHDLLDPSLSTYTVAGLARRWGLDNPAAANRLFRAQYGQPPAAYRKQNSGV